MPTAYRIVRRRVASDVIAAFSGEGARLYGGRWNPTGVRVVYASGSISLCTLEMLVHLGESGILGGYLLFRVQIPDELVETLDPSRLPLDWRGYPAPMALAALGAGWISRGETAVLEVPSALVPSESNYLLNPSHPAFIRLRIEGPFAHDFDSRLSR